MKEFSLKKVVKSPFFVYGFLFLLYFVLQLCFVNDPQFAIDEFDIYLGGKDISNGLLLYKEYSSQHMPLAYYISAVFDLFGATSWQMQRVCYYAFFSFGWVLIYHRNHELIGKKVCAFFPLFFISALQSYDMGTAILCEHIVAIGTILLILEFTRFYEERRVDLKGSIYISISVLLMFGSTFVAALAIAVIGGMYVLTSLYYTIRYKRDWKDYLKEVGVLFGVILLPWAIIALYFLAQKNLENAVYFSYEFNTTVYSKYAGAYSDTAATLHSVYFGSFPVYKAMVQDAFHMIFSGQILVKEFRFETFKVVLRGMLVLFAGLHLIHRLLQKKIILAVTEYIFLLSLGMRGIFNYHATQGVALVCLYAVMEVGTWTDFLSNKVNKKLGYAVGALVSICFISGYVHQMDYKEALPIKYEESTEVDAIKAITEDGEPIGLTIVFNSFPMLTDRPVYPNVGGSAWHWEVCKGEWLDTPYEDLPRVVIYQPGFELWNQKQEDYAPELAEIMEEDYTLYPSYSGVIYIRNDYYDEASKIMDQYIQQ